MVGEGSTEHAFLKHIKSLYIRRGCGIGITVRNAHGKGPDHVIDYAIRQCRNADYDRVLVLLDTDLPISPKAHKRAKSYKIKIIGSTPCIEGLLLKILSKHIPATSAECKQQCGVVLPKQLTHQESYVEIFPKELLDERRVDVLELSQLLDSLIFVS